jgi:hypothetical protein
MSKNKSFGERLVGVEFNPSKNGAVDQIKQKMAEVANLMQEERQVRYSDGVDYLDTLVFEKSMQAILDAQMTAVKYITLRPAPIPEG